MASRTGEDLVIDAKELCLTFDANDVVIRIELSLIHI